MIVLAGETVEITGQIMSNRPLNMSGHHRTDLCMVITVALSAELMLLVATPERPLLSTANDSGMSGDEQPGENVW